MTQVSRRQLKKETEDKINNLIYESLVICSNKSSVAQFLDDLLTPTEKIMLSKRLAIAYLLIKGYPYEAIRSLLKVSVTTIGSVSVMLKYRGNGIRKTVGTLNRQKTWRNFFQELGEMAVDLLDKGKGGNWKRAKSFEYQRKIAKQSPF